MLAVNFLIPYKWHCIALILFIRPWLLDKAVDKPTSISSSGPVFQIFATWSFLIL